MSRPWQCPLSPRSESPRPIWVGIAVSTRSKDVRAAQQLSVLGSVPPLIIVALMSLNVIHESTALAIGLAAALLAFDLLAWSVVAARKDANVSNQNL